MGLRSATSARPTHSVPGLGRIPLADEGGALIFNGRAEDDDLRTDKCFRSTFHTAPSQGNAGRYTGAVSGLEAVDELVPGLRFASGGHQASPTPTGARPRSSAPRFSRRRIYEDTGGARRTDTGHVQIQSQIPVFTQDAPDHDVLVAADESDVFGEYLPYRTWEAAAGGRHLRARCRPSGAGCTSSGAGRKCSGASIVSPPAVG